MLQINLDGGDQENHDHRAVDDSQETEEVEPSECAEQDQGGIELGLLWGQAGAEHIIEIAHHQHAAGDQHNPLPDVAHHQQHNPGGDRQDLRPHRQDRQENRQQGEKQHVRHPGDPEKDPGHHPLHESDNKHPLHHRLGHHRHPVDVALVEPVIQGTEVFQQLDKALIAGKKHRNNGEENNDLRHPFGGRTADGNRLVGQEGRHRLHYPAHVFHNLCLGELVSIEVRHRSQQPVDMGNHVGQIDIFPHHQGRKLLLEFDRLVNGNVDDQEQRDEQGQGDQHHRGQGCGRFPPPKPLPEEIKSRFEHHHHDNRKNDRGEVILQQEVRNHKRGQQQEIKKCPAFLSANFHGSDIKF